MSRIASVLSQSREQNRLALVTFLTVGFPDLEATRALVPALVAGGADLVELGVPFSDPLADGATIQRASYQALRQGVTLTHCLRLCRNLREGGVEVPLILMGYYNPVWNYGLERFAAEGVEAGVDGVIVVDLPPEEAAPLEEACQKYDLDLIFLLTPTSHEKRIVEVSRRTRGFIYCVSVAGVTGARAQLPADLPQFLARVRQKTTLPLAVGFGLSSRAHLEAVAQYAEAAVIGSALLNVIEKAPPEGRILAARQYLAELSGKG